MNIKMISFQMTIFVCCAVALAFSFASGAVINWTRPKQDVDENIEILHPEADDTSTFRLARDTRWDKWDKWDKGDDDKNFKCPFPWGIFPDPKDCSSYYSCSGNRSSKKKCKKNRHFDMYRKTCLPIPIAVCDRGKETFTTKNTKAPDIGGSTSKDNTFTCPNMFGDFPHPEYCDQYYSCSFYLPSLKTCPKKKLFDAIKMSCKPDKKVNCGSRKWPSGSTTAVTLISTTDESGPTGSSLTNKESSVSATAITHTNVAVITQSTSSDNNKDKNHISTTVDDAFSRSRTLSSDPTAGNTFASGSHVSVEQTPELKETKSTTRTQESTTMVRSRETATATAKPAVTNRTPTADSTTVTERPTAAPSTAKPTGPPETDCEGEDLDCIIKETGDVSHWFTCPEDIGSHPHPSSDKLFIFCINWKPSAKKCGQDLVFSKELLTCIPPENADDLLY